MKGLQHFCKEKGQPVLMKSREKQSGFAISCKRYDEITNEQSEDWTFLMTSQFSDHMLTYIEDMSYFRDQN